MSSKSCDSKITSQGIQREKAREDQAARPPSAENCDCQMEMPGKPQEHKVLLLVHGMNLLRPFQGVMEHAQIKTLGSSCMSGLAPKLLLSAVQVARRFKVQFNVWEWIAFGVGWLVSLSP